MLIKRSKLTSPFAQAHHDRSKSACANVQHVTGFTFCVSGPNDKSTYAVADPGFPEGGHRPSRGAPRSDAKTSWKISRSM